MYNSRECEPLACLNRLALQRHKDTAVAGELAVRELIYNGWRAGREHDQIAVAGLHNSFDAALCCKTAHVRRDAVLAMRLE